MPDHDESRRNRRSAAEVTGEGGTSEGEPGKRSGAPREQRGPDDSIPGGEPTPDGLPSNPMARGYAKAAEKNERVRQALPPLEPGERPGAVMAGAIFAGLVAAVFWVSLGIRLLTDVEIEGRQPNPVQLILFAGVMTGMAVGMWQVRYWAVLGFQMLLVLFLLAATLGLLTAQTVVQAIATTVLIVLAGFLFFRMIKAMARIQMPERRPPP